ncbi:MAG: hypothetical protein HRU20_29920, partial [Pseudomonadales bacterium]|nr:hypothetical protein [Pseudomonadales bacterium]
HVIVRKADKDEQKEDDKKNIYFKAEASIILKVEGTIDVEYQWKKLYGQQPKEEPIVSNCTGNTEPVAPPEDSPHNFKNSASVKLLLKGDAKMEGKCYAVKFAMAVGFQVGALKGTGPAAITTSLIPDMAGDDPVLGGRIDFTGLALYYMSIAEVQVKKKVNQKKVKSKGQMDGMDNDEEANTSTKVEANDGNSSISKDGAKVEEKNCAWVILEASSFPEDATETKTVLNLRNYDLF